MVAYKINAVGTVKTVNCWLTMPAASAAAIHVQQDKAIGTKTGDCTTRRTPWSARVPPDPLSPIESRFDAQPRPTRASAADQGVRPTGGVFKGARGPEPHHAEAAQDQQAGESLRDQRVEKNVVRRLVKKSG